MLPSVRICGFETIMAPALTAEATNQTADTFANSTRSISANSVRKTLLNNIEISEESDVYDSDIAHHHCLNGHLSTSSLTPVNTTPNSCGTRSLSAKAGIVRF